MVDYQIPAGTHIGHVTLQVAELERALGFYQGLVGFRLIRRRDNQAHLSNDGSPPSQIILFEVPGATPKPAHTAGLFHIAIRYPDRGSLAAALLRLIRGVWPLFGFSDHKVSEAIYLADPDGNGVEIYADRPRDAWPWRDGSIAMTTDPLDVAELLRAALSDADPQAGLPPPADIGHVHLRTSDLNKAEAFYHGVLGLDITQRDYPGALFLSAGGYHHHVAVNTWAGVGVSPPPPEAIGLRAFSLLVPDVEALRTLEERSHLAGVPFAGQRNDQTAVGFALRDPDHLEVEILHML